MSKAYSTLLAEQYERLLKHGNEETAVSCSLQTTAEGVKSSVKALESTWQTKIAALEKKEGQLALIQKMMVTLDKIFIKGITETTALLNLDRCFF